MATVFPKARYLHLVRDGRDLAFKRHLTDNPRRRLGRLVLKTTGALQHPRHLQAALSWSYQVDQFDAFRPCLPPERILDLTFEQICATPSEATGRICSFLGVPMTEACRRYLAEEIDPRKISQHREVDPALVRRLKRRSPRRCGATATCPRRSVATRSRRPPAGSKDRQISTYRAAITAGASLRARPGSRRFGQARCERRVVQQLQDCARQRLGVADRLQKTGSIVQGPAARPRRGGDGNPLQTRRMPATIAARPG